MTSSTSKGGYLLISLIQPILGIVAVATVVLWFTLSRWGTFSPEFQLGLKVAGGVVLLTFVGANVWNTRKDGGQRRGF